MTPVEARDPLREKHLAIIQSVISRMAGNSFEVRKWSAGLVSVVLGFSVDKTDWRLSLVASVAALVFWYLDSFYLYQERRFRTLFERVRYAPVAELEATPYFMNPDYAVGERAFPPPQGVTVPLDKSVLSVAFRDGLVELHLVAILIPAIVSYCLYK